VKADREGGRPLELMVERLDINGFNAKQDFGLSKFIPPCVFYAYTNPVVDQTNGSATSSGTEKVYSRLIIVHTKLVNQNWKFF
jgi:hypothetical protein